MPKIEVGLNVIEVYCDQRFLGKLASAGGIRGGKICVSFPRMSPKSGMSPNVESFGRREASESLRCPNRGGHGPSYGESCFALMMG